MCIVKKIVKQAFATFNCGETSKKSFQTQFENLMSLTQHLSPSELGLTPCGENSKEENYKAPVTFVNVHDNTNFTIGIFIIRKGCSIPLHDHPGMIGICKPVYGTLKVTSYERISQGIKKWIPAGLDQSLFVAKKVQEKIIESSDTCEILTPLKANYHSLQAIKEDVAIFDILAPPYNEDRDCNYYRVLTDEEQISLGFERTDEDKQNGILLLKKIPSPPDFFCDSEPYTGPPLDIAAAAEEEKE